LKIEQKKKLLLIWDILGAILLFSYLVFCLWLFFENKVVIKNFISSLPVLLIYFVAWLGLVGKIWKTFLDYRTTHTMDEFLEKLFSRKKKQYCMDKERVKGFKGIPYFFALAMPLVYFEVGDHWISPHLLGVFGFMSFSEFLRQFLFEKL